MLGRFPCHGALEGVEPDDFLAGRRRPWHVPRRPIGLRFGSDVPQSIPHPSNDVCSRSTVHSRTAVVLAAVTLLAALSGCVGTNGTVEMTPVDDRTLAERAASNVTEVPPDARRAVGQAPTVLRGTDATGSTETGANESGPSAGLPGPLTTDFLVERQGRYYAVTSRPATANLVVVIVDPDPGAGTASGATPSNRSRVDLADLPAADRRNLAPLFDRGASANASEESATGLEYDDAAFEASALTSGRELVVRDGADRLGVRVVGRKTAAERGTREYRAVPVADDPVAFASYVEDRWALQFDRLPDEQRAIVEEAIAGSYSGRSRALGGLRSLFPAAARLGEVAGPAGGYYVVSYEDRLYWTRVVWDYGSP